MHPTVGIDNLNLYASSLCIEAAEIFKTRGRALKVLERQKLLRRSLVPNFEDPVTLAVNAAKPIVEVDGPESFELLIVATESGVDYGKPLSSYVHRYLNLPSRCRNFEAKHACYAGTAGFQLAAPWVGSPAAAGKKALVIMTDIARRLFGTPHEDTEAVEGAGAVALSISQEPRVLALDPIHSYGAREVYDVTRPTPTLERANVMLSLTAYLDLLEQTWEEYRRLAGGVSFEKHFRSMIFHTPVVPLVEKAFRLLMESERPEASEAEILAAFERMTQPSLHYCREVGNLYSGSLYAALAGLIDHAENLPPGSRIGCFSYGSGSCAEFFSGRIAEEARKVVGGHRIRETLAARRKLSVPDYEAEVSAVERSLTSADFRPDRGCPEGLYSEFYQGKGLLVLDEVQDYYRRYAWS